MILLGAMGSGWATAALADDLIPITLAVERSGDLRWKEEPCAMDAIDSTGTTVAHSEAGDVIEVPRGRVDIVVACQAQEGIVRRTTRIQATRPQTLKVRLNPGFILAKVERDGVTLTGEIVVYDSFDHEVARGQSQTILLVDAGRVRVVGIIDKGTANSPRDAQGEVRTTVTAGQKAELAVDASDGLLAIKVLENGRRAGAILSLRIPGSASRVMDLPVDEAVAVPSGTWDVVSQLDNTHDFREELTKGVVVTPRKTTSRTINHRTGTVATKVRAGKDVTSLVELFLPGAEEPFNQVDPGTVVRLGPGRYVFRATSSQELDDGAKPVDSRNVTVGPGSRQSIALAPEVADVEVDARVGGQARPLEVSLWLPGADAPLVTRTSDASGHVSFAVAPQRVDIVATLQTPQGPLTTRRTEKLGDGRNRVRLDIVVGVATMQVMEGEAAVAADVRFFKRLKGGRPDGPPVLSVKAGEEAYLEPGIYTLSVVRKGEERLFGEVRIAAGRTVERALDWAAAVATP